MKPPIARLLTTPLVILDVGAARGLLPHWRPLGEFAEVYQVEPDPKAIALIEATNAQYGVKRGAILPFGLSGTGGKRTLHVFVSRSSSSLLEPQLDELLAYCDAKDVLPIEPVEVETRRLDEVLDERGVGNVDFVKLDTQGTELEILRAIGATREHNLFAIETEIGTARRYFGQATLPQWIEYAEGLGLELFDIVPHRYSVVKSGTPRYYERELGAHKSSPTLGRRLWEIDALFLRRPEPLLEARDVASLRKLAVAYCTNGFFANALRLMERAHELRVLPDEEFKEVRTAIIDWHAQVYRKRFALDVAGRVLEKMGERFAPTRYL